MNDCERKEILFVCIENSSRSQMAEAVARRLGLNASSAGAFPATRVDVFVVEAMEEVGIDMSHSVPKELTETMIEQAGLVVVIDSSLERFMPKNLRKKMGKKDIEWYIADPQGKPLESKREVRREIHGMTSGLAKQLTSEISQ
jgi:arsenate reductase (thioredoxin)